MKNLKKGGESMVQGQVFFNCVMEHQRLGFFTLNDNLAICGWVGLDYDR